MSLLKTKFVESNAITGAKFRLANDEALRARNAADSADVDLMKLNSSNVLLFLTVPTFASDPSNANDLTRKSWVDTQLGNKINSSEKGAASGVAPLDASSKISSIYLPSYVDDVLEYANLAAFPGTGETGKIYVALDTNLQYRWSGTVYTKVSPSDVNSVNGATGIITLDTDDISEPVTPTNKWFTDARAKAAAVADSITDGVTDVAPSQNAVFDALALKTNVADLSSTANAKGASLIGIEDSGAKFTATTVEAALAELKTDIQNSTGSSNGQEVLTLVAQDITNGYVDLAQEIIPNSLIVNPKGGLTQEPNVDYTLSTVSTKTRITFAGDLAALLIAGDKLICNYEY